MPENQQFKAPSETLRANILRLWSTFTGAESATGITRMTWYNTIQAEEVSDQVVGRLYKIGIDPAELVRSIEEKRA